VNKNENSLNNLQAEKEGHLFLKNFIDIKSLNFSKMHSEEFSLSRILFESSKINCEEYGNQKKIQSESENNFYKKNCAPKEKINFDKRYSISVFKSDNILKANEDKKLLNFRKKFFSERDNKTNKRSKNLLSVKEKENKRSNMNLLDVFNRMFTKNQNEDKKSLKSIQVLDQSKSNKKFKSQETCKSLNINETENLSYLQANKNSSNYNLNIQYIDKISEKSKGLDTSKVKRYYRTKNNNNFFTTKNLTFPHQIIKNSNNLNNSNKNETFSFLLDDSKSDLKISKNSSNTSVIFENNFNDLSEIIKENDTNNFILKENEISKIKINEKNNIENRNISYTNIEANKDLIDYDSNPHKQMNDCILENEPNKDIQEEEIRFKNINNNTNKNNQENNLNKFVFDSEHQTNIIPQNKTMKYYNVNNNFDSTGNIELLKKNNHKNFKDDKINKQISNNVILNTLDNQKFINNKSFHKNTKNSINLLDLQNLTPLGYFFTPVNFFLCDDINKIENFSKNLGNNNIKNKIDITVNNLNNLENKNNINKGKVFKEENNSIIKQVMKNSANINKNLFDENNSLYEVYSSTCKVNLNEYYVLYFREINLQLIAPFLKFKKKINKMFLKSQKDIKKRDKKTIKVSTGNLVQKIFWQKLKNNKIGFFPN